MAALNLGFYNTSGTRTHVRFPFGTFAAAGGNVAPASAFEAADLKIYRAADGAAISATERSSASGITMTSPFDSLTGFHTVDIDLTDNTDSGFYASGYIYFVVLAPDSETIDSQTITGDVLAFFEIGVPAVNVTQNAGTAITSASGIQEVKVASIANNAITAASIATDAIDADALKTDAVAEIAAGVRDVDNTSPAANSLGAAVNTASSAGDPWNTSVPGAYASGKAGYILGTYLDVAVSSRLASGGYTSPPSAATIAAAVRDVDNSSPAASSLGAVANAIKAKTDNLPSDPADASDIASSFSTVNSKLDAIDDYVDTEVAAIKAKTDNLPADPASASTIAAAFNTLTGVVEAPYYEHEFDSGFTSTLGTTWNGLFSLKKGGEFVDIHAIDAAATLAVSVKESTAGTELFALTAATVGSDGRWKLTKATPGFTADTLHRFEFTAVVDGVTYNFEEYVPVHG